MATLEINKQQGRALAREHGYSYGGFCGEFYIFVKEALDSQGRWWGKYSNVLVTAEDLRNGDAVYLMKNGLTRGGARPLKNPWLNKARSIY